MTRAIIVQRPKGVVIVTGENTAEAARQAAIAGDAAELAQAWAESEGEEPGGAGTKSAKEWAAQSQSYSNNTGLAQIIAVRRESLPDYTAETARVERMAAQAETDLKLYIMSLGGRVVWVKKTATGANNGTSEANAYTTISAALAASQEGDRIQLIADESDPFPALNYSGPVANYIMLDGSRSSSGKAWISGMTKSTAWADMGGGVFRRSAPGTVVAACYNLRRDTLDGAVSGVDLTDPQDSQDLIARGFDPSDCVAWIGSLKKSSPATTTPAEGEWSQSGGDLYINPPGTPTLSDVNTYAGYHLANTDLIAITKSTGGIHRGLCILNTVSFYGPNDVAAYGYGMKHNNCTESVFSGMVGIMCGDHHVCPTIGSGGKNTIRNSISIQQGGRTAGVASSFVFYISSGDLPSSGNLGANLVCLGIPLLNETGVPIRSAYYPLLGYSHTDTSRHIGGILWANCFQRDWLSEIEAKSGVTMTGLVSGFIGGKDNGGDFENGEFSTKVYGGKARGMAAFWSPWTENCGVVIDRQGFGGVNLTLYNFLNEALAAFFRVRGGTFKTGNTRIAFSQMDAADKIDIEGCSIIIQRTDDTNNPTFFAVNASLTGRIRLSRNIIDGVSSNAMMLLQAGGTFTNVTWPDVRTVLTADANIIGQNITQFIGSGTSQSGAYTPKDAAYWKANVTGAANDLTGALNPTGLA